MPTIRLSQKTKDKLDAAMGKEMLHKFELAKGNQKNLIISLARHKFGISYDNFIEHLLDKK